MLQSTMRREYKSITTARINPALQGPDAGNVRRPGTVRRYRCKIPIQDTAFYGFLVVAVCGQCEPLFV